MTRGHDRRAEARRGLRAHLQRLGEDGLWAVSPLPEGTDDPVGGDAAADEPTGAGEMFGADDAGNELASFQGLGESLAAIEREALGCTRCLLCEGRTNVVFGVGPARARVMFIGEGPGRDEDLQGEPFVGKAGGLLNRIIDAMKLRREEVYIANAVKCRPPQNRNPLPDELAACRPFLLRQVAAVAPEVIVLLGRVAVLQVLGSQEALGRLRGRFHRWAGIPVMCTYHPAYLLRNPAEKGKTWEDMQQVMRLLSIEAP